MVREGKKVPKIPHAFFRWYCRADRYEELHGDLEELFYERIEERGSKAARILYARDVLKSFHRFAWKGANKTRATIINIAMLFNYFKTSVRTLTRSKLYTSINVLGLTIGLVCCLMIYTIVKTETSFDNFHGKTDRIYRLVSHSETSNGRSTLAASFQPAAKALSNDFPELENTVAMEYYGPGLISIEDPKTGLTSRFDELEGIGITESAFFEIFDFALLRGNKEEVLSRPNTVALSQSAAIRYFGNTDPVGRTIMLDNAHILEVSGVYEDLPLNTDIAFKTMIISLNSMKTVIPERDLDSWRTQLNTTHTYVLFPENYPVEQLESLLPKFVEKYIDLSVYASFEFHFQPLKTVHTNTLYDDSYQQPVSLTSLNILMLIGVLIMIIACVNFINLSTAQSLKRAKNIALKKVLGSSRLNVMGQFFFETGMIVMMAVFLSLAVTGSLLNKLQSFIEFSMPIGFSISADIVLFALLVGLIVTVLSGTYPAILMSKFQPVRVFRGSLGGDGTGRLNIRRVLIVFQFIVSQALLIGVVVVFQQRSFLSNHDTGFDEDQIVVIPLPDNDLNKLDLLKNQLGASAHIISSSFSMSTPMTGGDINAFFDYTKNDVNRAAVAMKMADADFLETYGIELLAGRNIIAADLLDNILVNEKLVDVMGFEDPADAIGERIGLGRDRTIVGVVRDFNSESFHSEIHPLLIGAHPAYFSMGSLKISRNNVDAIQHIQNSWEKVYPEYVFDFEFFDQTIDSFYGEERQTSSLFAIFSSVSILISCIGLFGMVSFMAENKVKEVGIRKVLGASKSQVMRIFSTEFVKLILFGLIVASPLAWYLMDQWLSNFSYRINISPLVYAAAGILTLLITIISVGYRAYRAVKGNPVDCLRAE